MEQQEIELGVDPSNTDAAIIRAAILLADDDEEHRHHLSILFEKEGWEIAIAENGEQALELFKHKPFDLVISDVRMPKMGGLQLMERIHAIHPHVPVVLISEVANISEAVKVVKAGALDYLPKPLNDRDILHRVQKALRREALNKRSFRGRRRSDLIQGTSLVIRNVLGKIEVVAGKDVPVLILGESGTGKELVARAIHRLSPRATQRMISVNCGAIPEGLVENELFGHVGGAFTDARRGKIGLFEAAHRGTIFLDEIGELPPAMQAKLLRVLEDQSIRRVGATKDLRVDVRLVAATNRDLPKDVAAGRFREDLYYRINTFPIEVPPLRERKDDIPLIASQVVELENEAMGVAVEGITPAAMEALCAYHWPGNVRELINRVKQGMLVARNRPLRAEDLTLGERKQHDILSYQEAKKRFETDYLLTLIKHTRGNIAAAARTSGRDRKNLYMAFQKHKLDPKLFRSSDEEAES